MAKCSLCNKRSLFLKVNSEGLCSNCAEIEKKRQEELKKEAEQAEIRKKREEYLKEKFRLAKQELSDLPRYEIKLSSEKRPRQTGFEAVPFSNITPKGKYDEFVVFDTETTGLSPSKDRIIELAAVRFVDGKPTEVFETFINPEREIPQEVTSINHITNEMVCDAPSISQVLPSFEAFVGKSALVAHNLEFDLKFLYYSGSTILDTKRKFFDTLEQAKKMLKKPKMKYDKEFEFWVEDYDSDFDVCDYKLETLCGYYKINIPMQHRAAADAIATGKLFLSLIEEKRYTFKV